MGDAYLTLNEAADYLGVARFKFSRMAKRAKIPYTTSPYDRRAKLFRKSDLEELKRAPRITREVEEEESAPAAERSPARPGLTHSRGK